MSRKRRERQKFNRKTLAYLENAIATFDLKPNFKYTWGKIPSQPLIENVHTFGYLRTELLPEFLGNLRRTSKISKDQYRTLTLLVDSPDRDDWYMAFLAIKEMMNKK